MADSGSDLNVEKLKLALEKATNNSALFQKKNAELEVVNDKLRMENTELLRTIDQLSVEVRMLKSEVLTQQNTIGANTGNSKVTTKHNKLKTDASVEVHTLRRVRKELEEQLVASKSSTLSFQASFQAEFDLRNQIEQRLEELRERYERLISENEQLRLILAAHNITAPSPPGLRSMPGSRKKKHGHKPRPMTMYSDLSSYNQPPAASHKAIGMTKTSSLKSLEEIPLTNSSNGGSCDKSPDQEKGLVVLAETAQTVESDEMASDPVDEGVAVDTETTPTESSYPADTLMWNAKGFLSRIENSDPSTEGPIDRSERDVNELKEMMTSVSAKTLEGAKAFLEAKQRNDSTDNLNN